jgi:hypothetical protein
MSAAYRTLPRAAVAPATTARNNKMRVGGSIGVAQLAVVLQHALDGEAHGGAEAQADAFGQAFWWVAGLVVIALAAGILLMRQRPAEVAVPPSDGRR